MTFRIYKTGDGLDWFSDWASNETVEVGGQPVPRVVIREDRTYETECDGPHPVMIRADDVHADSMIRVNKPSNVNRVNRKTKAGWVTYLTFQCPGGCLHYYAEWQVQLDGVFTDEVYDSFAHAREAAEAHGFKTILGRRPKATTPADRSPSDVDFSAWLDSLPRTVVNDRATWTTCGHPAELNIENGCYTCGRSVERTAA